MRHLALVACGLALLQAASAGAQHPLVLSKLQELNAAAPQPSAEQLQKEIGVKAKAFAEANGQCVPTGISVREVAAITGARDVLQAALGGLIKNGWTAYAEHVGCPAGVRRYMVLMKADGTLIAAQVNEGRSFANPSIMRDTSALAALGALQKVRSVDANCDGKDMGMGPTRVAGTSPDLGPDIYGVRYVGSWTEIWQFRTCGKLVDVPIEFRADGDGGAYSDIKEDGVTIP